MKHHVDYKFQAGDSFNYSNEDIALLKSYSVYQTPKFIKSHVKNKFDLFKVLSMNPNEDGDLFILNCRWLRYKNKELNIEEQHYLWSRIRNKICMKRKGGSNGNKLDLKTLSSAISTSGKSLRMGYAEFWLVKDRKISLAYISSDTAVREVEHFHYSFPKREGQIVISRNFY